MRFCTHTVNHYTKGPRDVTGFSKTDVLANSNILCRIERKRQHRIEAAGERDVNAKRVRIFMEPTITINPEDILEHGSDRYKVERVDDQWSLTTLDHYEIHCVQVDDGA